MAQELAAMDCSDAAKRSERWSAAGLRGRVHSAKPKSTLDFFSRYFACVAHLMDPPLGAGAGGMAASAQFRSRARAGHCGPVPGRGFADDVESDADLRRIAQRPLDIHVLAPGARAEPARSARSFRSWEKSRGGHGAGAGND